MKKKKIAIVVCIIILTFFSIIAMDIIKRIDSESNITDEDNTYKPNGINQRIDFYEPDYDSNIFENKAYMNKNRYIQYTDGPVTYTLSEDDFKQYGVGVEFFNGYFNSLFNGDAEAYNKFFTDSYNNDTENRKLEKFTMQKIYSIEIEKLSQGYIENTDNKLEQFLFSVSYMIMENDGTFRNDLPSDVAIPLVFELIYDEETVKINTVKKYKNQY